MDVDLQTSFIANSRFERQFSLTFILMSAGNCTDCCALHKFVLLGVIHLTLSKFVGYSSRASISKLPGLRSLSLLAILPGLRSLHVAESTFW